MTAESPTILLPRCHATNLICRAAARESGLSELRKINTLQFLWFRRKSLTKSDGDQCQAEEVPADSNRHFPNSLKTRREPLFLLPALHSLTLSNWNSRNEANRPDGSRLLAQGTEMYF